MDRTYRYLDTDTLARLVDELYDEVASTITITVWFILTRPALDITVSSQTT